MCIIFHVYKRFGIPALLCYNHILEVRMNVSLKCLSLQQNQTSALMLAVVHFAQERVMECSTGTGKRT